MKLIRPTKGKITSRFGWRLKPKAGWHSGLDLANDLETPIFAAYRGQVVFTGTRGNYGNTIIIKHPNLGNVWTLYGHLSRILVKIGQWVEQGVQIGLMGTTGYSTGPHLHFEVRIGTNGIAFAKNPEGYINAI